MLISQIETNMPDLLVGLVLFVFFFLATPLFITRNSAAWVIPAQLYRLIAESEQNNKLCVALHPGLLIA